MSDFPNAYGRVKSVLDGTEWQWTDFRGPLKRAGLLPTTIPLTFGHGNTYKNWHMLGNGPDDSVFPGFGGAGDCVWASADNETKISLTDATYTPTNVTAVDALFNGKTAISDYSAATGYNAQTGANDNGTEIKASLEYRQHTGIVDTTGKRHKIGPYVIVEAGNLQHLLEAIYFFEAIPIGLEVTEANENQYQEGAEKSVSPIWDYVSGSSVVGGHCIPMVGRPDSKHITAITWGLRILLTESLLAKQVDEVWAYSTVDRINKVTGQSYEKVTQAQLEEYLHLVGKAAKI